MERRLNIPLPSPQCDDEDGQELDTLLHPERVFDRPSEVVRDPDLTLNEKRAILASWASDACAVEAAPSLRSTPKARQLVRFDDIMDALRALDSEARKQTNVTVSSHRVARRGRRGPPENGSDEGKGHPFH